MITPREYDLNLPRSMLVAWSEKLEEHNPKLTRGAMLKNKFGLGKPYLLEGKEGSKNRKNTIAEMSVEES